jgi:FlaA1/EpsC-like NDP-sugar epimerase
MTTKFLDTEFESHTTFFEQIVGRSEISGLTGLQLREFFESERILVVGAGGTIGSAIARKLVQSNMDQVFFLDRDESALHKLALSLSNEAASHSEKCVVADIKDYQSIHSAISILKPTLILHAAALKHLVMLERFPRDGYVTNVLGTLNLLNAASDLGVHSLINISTDKAANPTSILGLTKKVTELLVEEYSVSKFQLAASVRFGNVFASRGSVIETFIHQLKNNLPVTITDPRVDRYFMSHNEAANLVLSAASLRENGTFVQNMGQEVLITEIVSNLAHWLGVEPKINYVGLQPGEKLHEELFDGPVTSTKYSDIVKINETRTRHISSKLQGNTPSSHLDITNILSELIHEFHE